MFIIIISFKLHFNALILFNDTKLLLFLKWPRLSRRGKIQTFRQESSSRPFLRHFPIKELQITWEKSKKNWYGENALN